MPAPVACADHSGRLRGSTLLRRPTSESADSPCSVAQQLRPTADAAEHASSRSAARAGRRPRRKEAEAAAQGPAPRPPLDRKASRKQQRASSARSSAPEIRAGHEDRRRALPARRGTRARCGASSATTSTHRLLHGGVRAPAALRRACWLSASPAAAAHRHRAS